MKVSWRWRKTDKKCGVYNKYNMNINMNNKRDNLTINVTRTSQGNRREKVRETLDCDIETLKDCLHLHLGSDVDLSFLFLQEKIITRNNLTNLTAGVSFVHEYFLLYWILVIFLMSKCGDYSYCRRNTKRDTDGNLNMQTKTWLTVQQNS